MNKPNSQQTSRDRANFRGNRGQGREQSRGRSNRGGFTGRTTARRSEYEDDGDYWDEYDENEQNQDIYEKPNGVVRFEVKKVTNKNDTMINESDNYSCIAYLAIDNESSKQSQADSKRHQKKKESVIGREKSEELIESNAENANSEETTTTECDVGLMSHRTIKVDDLSTVEKLEGLLVENPPDILNSEVKQNEAMLWHIRLGHASLNYLKMLQKKEKILEHVKFDESIRDCEIIHSDIMGWIKPTSWPGGKKYIMTFVDDYSRYARIYCLKSKDESSQAFGNYLTTARNPLDWVPPYTPELNGVAESSIKQRTIRALMYDSGLPPSMCHIEQIRRFGCIAYIKLPKTETKFSSVSVKAVLVGHTDTGYILWHPSSRKFLESRHVRFLEKLVYKDTYKKSQTESTENSDLKETVQRKRGRPKKTSTYEHKQDSELNKKKSDDLIDQITGPITRSKSKKINDISFARYTKTSEIEEVNEDELGHILLASIQEDPISYTEAVNSEDKDL
ncbi:hypothetical protein TSAR_014972 [Trichomalopsis sarcophagae]|uniref:Uncharacterized protein n=1 Tax=Trichomalopsis sarcophagae TaxID=543379 RepID=A0A232EIP2_9HYME|nr:hypothetical protein TSAR_014972 [Trichomalopsis sarcophagae]